MDDFQRQTIDASLLRLADIQSLLPDCVKTLGAFYNPKDGFRSRTNSGGRKPVSHALCITAYLECSEAREAQYARRDEREGQLRVFLETQKWSHEGREELYALSTTFVGMTQLLRENPESKATLPMEFIDSKAKLLTEALERVLSQSRSGEHSEEQHAMLLYLARWALHLINDTMGEEIRTYSPVTAERLAEVASRLTKLMESRLHYFISMCSAIPDNHEDGVQLGYLAFSLAKFDGFDNDVLLNHAWELCITRVFPSGQPPRLHRVSPGIHSSPLELLTLLSSIPLVSSRFLKIIRHFELGYEWLRATRREMSVEAGSNRDGGARLRAVWTSEPWRGVGAPEAWVNAAALRFLNAYQRLLTSGAGSLVQTQLGASRRRPSVEWDRLLSADGSKEQMERGFGLDEQSPPGSCSALLFGPPGTAKTSFARALAWAKGWPFLEVTPHLFAEDGLEGVIRRAKWLFERLHLLESCVVLFDELDELALNREDEHDKLSRFITVSMLPWFQSLHDHGRLIFIATTNRIARFDPAVKRPGRFDLVLPIGPPTSDERATLLSDRMIRSGVEASQVESLVSAICDRIEACEVPPLGSSEEQLRHSETTIDRSWQPTIGELFTIADQVVAPQGASGTRDPAVGRIQMIVDRLAAFPLISPEQYNRYSDEAVRYRHPPVWSAFGDQATSKTG